MKYRKQRPAALIDLGFASKQTLGATGTVTDFVRMMEHWGISRD